MLLRNLNEKTLHSHYQSLESAFTQLQTLILNIDRQQINQTEKHKDEQVVMS